MIIEDQKLPKGWRLVKLGDISNRIHYGFTASADFSRTEPRLLRITDIQNGLVKWNTVPGCKISPNEEADNLLINGDIVIARTGATTGKSFLVQNPPRAVFASYLIRIQPSSQILPQYLYAFCQSSNYWKQIEANARGAAQEGVNATLLSSLILPLPPLEEQKRIVGIAQKADRLRRTRRYALQLSDTYLRSVFLEMFGDPISNQKAWKTKLLDEISEVQGGLQLSQKRDNLELKLPYLRVANVYRNKLDLSEIKTIGLTKNEFIRVKLQKNDILIVEGHGNAAEIGRCAVWDGSIKDCVHQNHLIRVRVNSIIINSTYLSHYINNSGGQKYFHTSSNTTSGLNTISTGIVKQCIVPIPPLPLQEKYAQIAQKFDRLRTQQREADRQAEHLFQTILHRAFRGELTSQNADDEPESVLLEEIRAQQAKAKAEGKTATQAMGEAADYLGTKAKQQDIEPIQLKFPGFE